MPRCKRTGAFFVNHYKGKISFINHQNEDAKQEIVLHHHLVLFCLILAICAGGFFCCDYSPFGYNVNIGG